MAELLQNIPPSAGANGRRLSDRSVVSEKTRSAIQSLLIAVVLSSYRCNPADRLGSPGLSKRTASISWLLNPSHGLPGRSPLRACEDPAPALAGHPHRNCRRYRIQPCVHSCVYVNYLIWRMC